jgi:hypothetical protein
MERRVRAIWSNIRAESAAPFSCFMECLLVKIYEDHLRGMQMVANKRQRGTTEKRSALWKFTQLGTLRRKLIQRAGRLTRPQRKLTLTMSINLTLKLELLHYLNAINQAA